MPEATTEAMTAWWQRLQLSCGARGACGAWQLEHAAWLLARAAASVGRLP
jgi:hypothetical protein